MNNEENNEVVYLYLDDIIPNRFQPREVFDDRALKELAVSIREHGVIQPIIVRSVNGKYEIIAGERRYKASALAGLTKIPAIIRNLDDKESSKVALLENLQRKNLSPIEEARTYQKILEIDQMTQEALAKTMGKSQSAVANKLRLLTLPDEIQNALLKEQISERHARALLNIPDASKQKELLKKIVNDKMSVRALEEEIKELYPKDPRSEVAANNTYVNDQPLAPTAEIPSDEDEYGKIKIVPPTEGESEPEILNYGEIGKDEDFEEEETLDIDGGIKPVDISEIKESASDIRKNAGPQSGGLDSLLNLDHSSSGPAANGKGYDFITPAESIVKESSEQEVPADNDYFKPTNDLPQIEEEYNIDTATNKIRDLVSDLQAHGIKIETDEMDFEKSFQIIIKIEK